MNPLRSLPSVAKVLEWPAFAAARAEGATALTDAIRAELNALRVQWSKRPAEFDPEQFTSNVLHRLAQSQRLSLRTVINATGIVLHTNLGRSPLAESAAKAAYVAGRGYLNLELSLDTGKRSSRQDPIREGVKRLTGAEAATAVNNCAAATVLVLRSLAQGKEVIVSRGQLVEIGGSFRIPEIMAASGAILKEVGSTNITRLSDYENAIGPNTGLLMRIHCSNFRVRGFTKSVGIEELAALGKSRGIAVVDDVGSGAALDFSKFDLPGEPTISEGIQTWADLVLFSGDKLLGGPQAGIIAGKKTLIETIEKDPLMRAFRLDKMTLAALEATLQLHRDESTALREIPALRMLTMPLETIRIRAAAFAARLREHSCFASVEVQAGSAFVGGGSLPDIERPTVLIAVTAKCHTEEEFARRLRAGTPAVMGRIHDSNLLLDLRTVFPEQEADLLAALLAAAV